MVPSAWSAVALAFTALPSLSSVCQAQASSPQEGMVVRFGTTVVMSSGLRGEIYHLPPDTTRLPKFGKLKPVGTIYTAALNIPPTEFTQGFPGVTNRIEWFAIDYTGRFWIREPGKYRFALMSDDGSKLYIDGHLAIDNDGVHPAKTRDSTVTLRGGVHGIRVSYFQGPGGGIALTLTVSPPGKDWRVFSMDEFTPPADSAAWKFGDAHGWEAPSRAPSIPAKK